MNGIDYLLDTNFILGMMKSAPETMALGAELLTHDQRLQAVMAHEIESRVSKR